MLITITVPPKREIFKHKNIITVAKKKGDRWSKKQFKEYQSKRGVYIIHSGRCIYYVGKTYSKKWGTFGERLRREFQLTSSQNSKLHTFLSKKRCTIYCHFITSENIHKCIITRSRLSKESRILILEQSLIGIYQQCPSYFKPHFDYSK